MLLVFIVAFSTLFSYTMTTSIAGCRRLNMYKDLW